MNKTDSLVVKSISQWITEGKTFFLCTIISAKGASVRPLGSLFAYDGESKVGFISEPGMDHAFCKHLDEANFQEDITYFTYGNQLMNKDNDLCLPCCGTVTLMIEKFSPTQKSIELLKEWTSLVERRVTFRRTIDKTNYASNLEELTSPLTAEEKKLTNNSDEIKITYTPTIQVLIIGATPVSKHLARLASELGFIVRLCENRKLFLEILEYDKANNNFELSKTSSGVFVQSYVDKYSSIVSLAHDPSIDDDAIITALSSDSFYVGAIGSTKNCDKRVRRLSKNGIDESLLSKLHAPIGISINSKTPDEIAISIIAEIIEHKHKL